MLIDAMQVLGDLLTVGGTFAIGWVTLLCLALSVAVAWGYTLRGCRSERARATRLSSDLEQAQNAWRQRTGFLNAISHDLRTPLNGVMLQTHVIERALERGDDPLLRQAIADIRIASLLAADILDALMQYAQTDIAANTLARVNLKDLFQRVTDPFRAAAEEKQLGFSLHVPENIAIDTDAAKLERVLANLLDNALKFTNHGAIAVECIAAVEQPGVQILIKDTGEGILPEDQRQLFSEFFQVNNPSRDARLGLGLGLVVARRLVEQVGGTLVCISEPGRGSAFKVDLPQHAIEDLPKNEPARLRAGVAAQG